MEQRSRWERIRGVDPRFGDGALAALILILTLLGTFVGANLQGRHEPDVVAYGLVFVACVPLTFRRRAPLSVLWVVCVATVAYAGLGYRDNLVLPLALASCTAAAYEVRDRVLKLAVPPAVVAGIATQVSTLTDFNWIEVLVGVTFAVGIPLAIGRIVYNRRRRQMGERERAAHDAVAEERARIARELHDIVAHAMSVMVVQAGAARTVVERDPAEARLALRRIEETGRSGLAEMRRLIGILKAEDDGATLAPQPGLDQLDRLLDTVRGAGLPVEVVIMGVPRPLPPGMDLTAYRFVQEGLTNVLKHAGNAHARATVRYTDDALELEVVDDGRGPPEGDGTAGHGLIGMRERVALFEGTLEAGARPEGGFRLHAYIPIERTAVR